MDEEETVAAVYNLIAIRAERRDGVPRGRWDDLPEDRRPALRGSMAPVVSMYERLSERHCLL